MHELGITQSIVDIALRHARQAGARQINSVTVEIGALSGVIPAAVEFCFETCSRATLLEGAALQIVPVPGRGRCTDCGWEGEIDTLSYACPACDALALERLQGEELRITEMEVD